MAKRKQKNIDRLMRSRQVIEKAAAEGVNDALRRHVEAGVPAAEWVGGRLVLVTPRRLAARLKGNGGKAWDTLNKKHYQERNLADLEEYLQLASKDGAKRAFINLTERP